MAKYSLRIKARQMRKRGKSVKEIALKLGVSKSSASIWVRDIILTVEQLEHLRKSSILGSERGRLKSALLQKERWLKNFEKNKNQGIKEIGKLTNREMLIAGIALYWGEGSKKGRKIELCNSDPKLVKFFILWLQKCLNINYKDIYCYVGINLIHKKRDTIIKRYWSELTGIPINRFNKTVFRKAQNKKIYANYNEYYGTLIVRVQQPSRIYGKIMGLLEGLSQIDYANVAQG